MRLANEKPEYLNCDSNRNLDFTTAYALLSAPDEVKQEVQAKQQLPHGEFGDWLKVNCRVKEDMARRYMKLANEKPEYLNCDSNNNLDISTAYALLSAPYWQMLKLTQRNFPLSTRLANLSDNQSYPAVILFYYPTVV